MHSPTRISCRLEWVALVALLLAEFVLFDRVGARHYARIYPRWNDQVQYLSEAYTGYEAARTHGLGSGLWQTLVNPSAQGSLHGVFAVVVFRFAGGPSRSAALAVNMLALLLWQAALFLSARRATGSRALAWGAAALPLALAWPWTGLGGSAYDFRLDHLAMCGMGITLCGALLTDGLRSLPGAIALGLAAGITVLTRFIVAVYLAPIFLLVLGWALLAGAGRARRVSDLLVAAGLAAALAGPVLWLNRELILNYYWVGHITGPERAIRDSHLDLLASFAWLGDALLRWQLGLAFIAIAGAGGLLLAAGWFVNRRASVPAARGASRGLWCLGALFLVVPAAVLAVHNQKSPAVVGVLAPGAIALVLAAWARAARRATPAWRAGVAATVVLGCGVFFVRSQIAAGPGAAVEADARKVAALADDVLARSQAARIERPSIGVDYITDSLDAQILRVVCYERHRVWQPFDMTLPTGIFAEKKEVLFDRLQRSDFVFLTEEGATGIYPYDRQLAELRPQTRAWCEAHLRLVERFDLAGRRMALYQRREIPVLSPASR